MAFRMRASASSRVSPAATQPGKSGTYAPNDVGPSSTTTRYRIPVLLLLQPGLLQHAVESPCWDVRPRLACDRNRYGLRGGLKLPMTALGADENPTVSLDECDQVPDLHSTSLPSSPHQWPR